MGDTMDWAPPPPPPPADNALHGSDVHEVVVPAEEQDEQHTWVDLDEGVVHIVLPSEMLPPERFGSVWEPEPRAQQNEYPTSNSSGEHHAHTG